MGKPLKIVFTRFRDAGLKIPRNPSLEELNWNILAIGLPEMEFSPYLKRYKQY